MVGYRDINGHDNERQIKERKKRAFTRPTTLAQALKYAHGLESTDQHSTRVENQTTTEVAVKQEINKTTVDKSREKLCFNCGKHWPQQGGQRKCPAFGKQCTRCGKRNHFAKCCKNKQEFKLAQGGEQITDTSPDSSDEDSTCTLQEANPMGQSDNRPLKTVLISSIDITVLPDSGATVNAMDEATFKKYGLEKRVKIRKSRCPIKPYGAAQPKEQTPCLFWVVLKRLWNLRQKWFQGIGKLKGIQVDLNVDPDFKPVAQPPRLQPFSVHEKMEEEIKHLIHQDIIEKVNEPMGWVSPPVVTPKKDQSQIRLNVDMRVGNQAIPRRHTQHPTIDDVVNELTRSAVLSHLDMSKGYHQLEFKESAELNDLFNSHWLIQI